MGEQFIACSLADTCKDLDSAVAIMNTNDPYLMKSISKKIKGTEEQMADWDSKIESVALTASMAKFSAHPKMKEFLVSTYPRKLAEASTEEPWGCGLRLDHPDVLNPE